MGYVPRSPPPPTTPSGQGRPNRDDGELYAKQLRVIAERFTLNTPRDPNQLSPSASVKCPPMADYGDRMRLKFRNRRRQKWTFSGWLRRIGRWMQKHRAWFLNIPPQRKVEVYKVVEGYVIKTFKPWPRDPLPPKILYDFENRPPAANLWLDTTLGLPEEPPKP